jgi:protein-disulfide isomerase
MNIEAPETPAAAPEIKSPPPQAVMVVRRVVFNYVVIAVVFLAIGIAIGVVGYSRVVDHDKILIDQSVAKAIAALPSGAAAGQPNPNVRQNVSITGQPSMGPDDAPVVIVEFGDFHCTYCKRFQDQTITPLLQKYGDQVKFVYRDFPILGPDSLSAALAAACAQDQNAFWPFHDQLFANPTTLTRDAFVQYATALNLNLDQFTTCYDNQQHNNDVLADYNDGQTLGVSGTPTFFINGKILVGAQPLEQFSQRIDAELSSVDETKSAS